MTLCVCGAVTVTDSLAPFLSQGLVFFQKNISYTRFMFYKGWSIRADMQIWQKIKGWGLCTLEKLRVARQPCLGMEQKDIHSNHVNVG